MNAVPDFDTPIRTLGGYALNQVYCEDALTFLKGLPDESVNCIVTSPPYFGLRDYGIDGQIGLEETPEAYVTALVAVFHEARRVLRSDGTFWLNLGDSYNTDGTGSIARTATSGIGLKPETAKEYFVKSKRTLDGLARKQLFGIPWRVAFALQADGWILRSDIIWDKPNPMPESVKDRPTKSHEYIFLLTKCADYWYDADAIKTPVKESSIKRQARAVSDDHKNSHGAPGQPPHSMFQPRPNANKQDATGNRRYTGFNERYDGQEIPMANARSVWHINTTGFDGAHFATFPPKLIEPMILAGCPEAVCAVCGAPYERRVERQSSWEERKARGATAGNIGASENYQNGVHGDGVSHDLGPKSTIDYGFYPVCECNGGAHPGIVYDPFFGAGTTGLVARALGRNYLGSEISPEYVAIANERLRLPFEDHYITPANDLTGLPLFDFTQEEHL